MMAVRWGDVVLHRYSNVRGRVVGGGVTDGRSYSTVAVPMSSAPGGIEFRYFPDLELEVVFAPSTPKGENK